jgi:hypothetical protein
MKDLTPLVLIGAVVAAGWYFLVRPQQTAAANSLATSATALTDAQKQVTDLQAANKTLQDNLDALNKAKK